MNKTPVIAVALLVVAAGTLWTRRDDAPGMAPPPLVEREPTRTISPPSPALGDATSVAVGLEPAAAALERDDGADALARAMAERTGRRIGGGFVDYLAEQGLARADAEPIVAALMREMVDCGFDGMRAQALEQRVPFDDVLNALEAQLHDADGPPVTALLDIEAVGRREMPCSLAALQRSGIAPQAAAKLLQETVNARGLRRAPLQ